MSFSLLESDDEGFTDVLKLLDDYNAAILEAPHCLSQSKSVSPLYSLVESPAWTAFEAAQPVTRTTSKHRNGARELRRQEVQFLRTCVKMLDTQRGALEAIVEQRIQATQGTIDTSLETTVRMKMWKDLAARQLEQRLASESENIRLKSALEDLKKVQEMLQRALQTRAAQRVMKVNLTQETRTRRVHEIPLEGSRQEGFHELEVGVDLVVHEAAKVFGQAEIGIGGSLGVVGDKTLPFEPDLTAEVAWRCLAHAFQHEKYHFSYSRERPRLDFGDVTRDDTVCESFGVEIQTPDRMAEFRIRQVFRRYHEASRTVIAWKSFIDPVEFQGQKLAGYRFQEKGSCVIRGEPLSTCSPSCTLLRIWHVITPDTLAYTHGVSSQYVEKLSEFVLRGSSSASTVQMIENMLIEQSR